MTLSAEEQVDYAKRVFLKFVMNDAQRISYGMTVRDWVHEQVKQNLNPDHYRLHWLRTSAKKVNQLLSRIAEAFNTQHADDHASCHDLLDVLETAKGEWRKRRERGIHGV